MNEGFDSYAATYEADLERALACSGEGAAYFAERRIAWLTDRLAADGHPAEEVLDFGCGTGNALPFIRSQLRPARIIGADVSEASLRVAAECHGAGDIEFANPDRLEPGVIDVAFCNGVIHHIPPSERQQSLARVFASLKPGGRFALFENSRWNPATRWVMSRCVFDHDAIPLSAAEARTLLRQAGFEVLLTRYLFIFPACLGALRWLEPALSPLPLGTQYVVWARKPTFEPREYIA